MPDKFNSMKSLLKAIPAEGNYEFEICRERQSVIKLFAPHGGCIEPGTRRIVQSLASKRWDYFIFRGRRNGNDCYDTLHVTSEGYDEERCVDMANSAILAVAVHGRGGDDSRIEVGGGSFKLAKDLVEHLREHGYPAVPAPRSMDGSSPKSFVNLAREKGIQLELTDGFRNSLFSDYPKRPQPRQKIFDGFIETLRAWLTDAEKVLDSVSSGSFLRQAP